MLKLFTVRGSLCILEVTVGTIIRIVNKDFAKIEVIFHDFTITKSISKTLRKINLNFVRLDFHKNKDKTIIIITILQVITIEIYNILKSQHSQPHNQSQLSIKSHGSQIKRSKAGH